MEKIVYVTVGTTEFNELIETISKKSICKKLEELGYTKLVLQIGKGTFEPESYVTSNFKVEYYRYKESIASDIQTASLVVSHAGAGSVLETLGAGRPMIVIINELLMGNHQLELAHQLYKDGHLIYATPRTLEETLGTMNLSNLKPFPRGETEKFAAFVDEWIGFS